jgi:hypothetical protein
MTVVGATSDVTADLLSGRISCKESGSIMPLSNSMCTVPRFARHIFKAIPRKQSEEDHSTSSFDRSE